MTPSKKKPKVFPLSPVHFCPFFLSATIDARTASRADFNGGISSTARNYSPKICIGSQKMKSKIGRHPSKQLSGQNNSENHAGISSKLFRWRISLADVMRRAAITFHLRVEEDQ
jgi:hypothetical protein